MIQKSVISIITFISLLVAKTQLDISRLEPSRRNDGRYTAWVFFTDKGTESAPDVTNTVDLHPNTFRRRQKVGMSPNATWFDRFPSERYITDILNTGAELRHQSRWLNSISIIATVDQLQTVAEYLFVKDIRPVFTHKRSTIQPEKAVGMAKRPISNGLDYGYAQQQIEQLNIHLAHDAGYFGQGVRVLVMDTGFNLTHEAFDSLIIVDEWDFIENDSITENQVTQDTIFLYKDSTIIGISKTQHDHGTMVLSTLGGYAEGNLIGPAFGAEFLLAKTEILRQEIQIEEDNYVAGLEWGEANGAEVVSTSLGYMDWYAYADMDGNTAVTTQAVDMAVSLGMVCVTAAGNEGNKNWYYIIAPADADSVISVGAVTSSGVIWNRSSHGPTYDGRIKPEVCARGVSTACVKSSGSGYTHASGTSLATPLVGGSVAIILSAHPDWTPMEVRQALMMTASHADQPDNDYGYGVIDVWAAINYNQVLVRYYLLSPVYPNPFNTTTNFRIDILVEGRIQVAVYDINGKEVLKMIDRFYVPGIYDFSWDGNNYASGVYLIRMNWDGGSMTSKATLLK